MRNQNTHIEETNTINTNCAEDANLQGIKIWY